MLLSRSRPQNLVTSDELWGCSELTFFLYGPAYTFYRHLGSCAFLLRAPEEPQQPRYCYGYPGLCEICRNDRNGV